MKALSAVTAFVSRTGAIPGVPAAALLAGLVFLFQPAQIYYANSPFFSFGMRQMGTVLLAGFLLCFAILACIAALGGPRWRMASATVLSALATAAWGGATFLTSSTGLIDGRSTLVPTGVHQWLLNAAYLAFAVAGAIAAWLRPTQVRRLFGALFIVLAIHSGWLVTRDARPWPTAHAGREFMTLSLERNVLVIILDTFQADFFAEILRIDPTAARSMEGFTYFPDAVGHSPTTYLAMPTIHSGNQFDEGEGIQAIYDKKVVEGSFVSKLAAAGYDAMVVNPVMDKCPKGARCPTQEALMRGLGRALVESSRYLLGLALFRTTPAALKDRILGPVGESRTLIVGSDELLDQMAAHAVTGAKKPVLRFVHLYNSHPPSVFDEHCNFVRGVPWRRATAIAQDRCVVRKVSNLLDALKNLGVYDQTAILILADHGAAMSGHQDAQVDWSQVDNWGPSASPLFLAKPFGARGELSVSPRVVGLSDTAATVCAWTGACQMEFGADINGPETAPAYDFAAYRWDHNFWFQDKVPIENRFKIRGPPNRIASWWRLTNLPERPVSELRFGTSDAAQHYGMGWSHFEGGADGSRWALGSESDLYLDLDPSRDAQLALYVSTHPANPRQSMVIEVNGTKVTEIEVPPATLVTPRITVPARIITKGANRILFRFREWNAPRPDPRPLAVYFMHLKIE